MECRENEIYDHTAMGSFIKTLLRQNPIYHGDSYRIVQEEIVWINSGGFYTLFKGWSYLR